MTTDILDLFTIFYKELVENAKNEAYVISETSGNTDKDLIALIKKVLAKSKEFNTSISSLLCGIENS